MNKKILSLTLLLSALWSSSAVLAAGEVFKLDTYGTKYCANTAPIELDPTNSPPYWAKVDSTTQITVYFDSALTQKAFTLPVNMTPLTEDANGRLQYAVDSLLGPVTTGYLAINGTVKTNIAQTTLKFFKVNFIRRGLLDTCSSSGYMIGKRVL